MAVSCVNIIFFNSQKSFFFPNVPHIIKLKFKGIKNTVRVPSRMKITKNLVFLHYFSKFVGIFLFVLNMYISSLLKMINGFSWPAKIMASPFKIRTLCPATATYLIYLALSHVYKFLSMLSVFIRKENLGWIKLAKMCTVYDSWFSCSSLQMDYIFIAYLPSRT